MIRKLLLICLIFAGCSSIPEPPTNGDTLIVNGGDWVIIGQAPQPPEEVSK